MIQDNTEVTFKDDLQRNLKCQKYLIPKDENFNIIQQPKLRVYPTKQPDSDLYIIYKTCCCVLQV